jgi:hypothetical protein
MGYTIQRPGNANELNAPRQRICPLNLPPERAGFFLYDRSRRAVEGRPEGIKPDGRSFHRPRGMGDRRKGDSRGMEGDSTADGSSDGTPMEG